MPVFKDMLKGRFWLSVAITLLVSAAVNALGALLISKGLLPYEIARRWTWAAWAVGAFVGGRYAVKGKDATLVRSLLTLAVAWILVLLAGLAVPGSDTIAAGWLGALIASAVGAIAAGLLKPSAGKKRKKSHDTPVHKKRKGR